MTAVERAEETTSGPSPSKHTRAARGNPAARWAVGVAAFGLVLALIAMVFGSFFAAMAAVVAGVAGIIVGAAGWKEASRMDVGRTAAIAGVVLGVLALLVAFLWLRQTLSFPDIMRDALRQGIGPEAAVYALAAIGLNVHFGYTGLLNFGQVAFMLLGAYGVAVVVATFGGPLWLGVVVGIAASVVLALILGIPTLRLRADYLAITTIAAAEILRLLFRSNLLRPVTNSVFGLQQFADSFYNINPIPPGRYGIWVVEFTHRRLWVVVAGWGLALLCVGFVYLLMHSPWGRVLKSIREDEDAARSLGKNVFAYKMQSLVIGGVIGSFGGMILAINQQAVNPDTYIPVVTFFAYVVLILGGPGRVFGPVLGAIIFWTVVSGIDTALRQAIGAGHISPDILATQEIGIVRFALVGLGLMLLMIYRPQGILGDRREMLLEAR